MTNEEIRIAIAESLGFKTFDRGILFWTGRKCENGFVEIIGNYPESLDACAEFERTLTDPVDRANYIAALIRIVLSGDEKLVYTVAFDIVTATPLQRCQAYLNVKGLWK